MRPVQEFPQAEATALSGLLFDLDDTFLTSGEGDEAAIAALFRLRASGLTVLALTGRPSSWGHVLAHMLPVAGVISENGAFAHFREGHRVLSFDTVTREERERRRQRLLATMQSLRQLIPSLPLSDDSPGRVTDVTFDIGEYNRATDGEIALARTTAEAQGARTTRSSVHLHVTYDHWDKATGAVHFLARRGYDSTEVLRRFVFLGDSENDAPCFAAFKSSIAVQNLRGRFNLLPRFQTRAAMSAGFVEAAETLLRLRSGASP